MHEGFCLLGFNANAFSLHRLNSNKDLEMQFYHCWFFFLFVCIDFCSAGGGTQRLV